MIHGNRDGVGKTRKREPGGREREEPKKVGRMVRWYQVGVGEGIAKGEDPGRQVCEC